jgi:hypothetical protein
MRLFLASLVVMIAACSPEQSRDVGAQPKKTVDSVSSKVGNLMQQGQDSERLKEGEAK